MKALGKGSIASIVQVGLQIAWIVLVVLLISLGVAIVSYAGFMVLVALGSIDPASIPAIERAEGGGITLSFIGADPTVFTRLQWTDWQIIAPLMLAITIGVGGSLIIVDRLRRLFDSFTSAEPFRRENAQHLRTIWITMVVMELSRYLVSGLFVVLLATLGAPEFVGALRITIDGENLSSWLSILVLVVLAEVFREGARLKEEQELTI